MEGGMNDLKNVEVVGNRLHRAFLYESTEKLLKEK